MSFTETVKTVAARCNSCGCDIIFDVNYFQLADSRISIDCPRCGKSTVTLNARESDDVFMSVPCPACGETHSFTRRLSNFFKSNEDIFRFMCPLAGVEICFIGEQERIYPAIDRSRQDLAEMISRYQQENGVPEEDSYTEKIKKHRLQTKLKIAQLIKECAAHNSIFCICKGMKSATSLTLHTEMPDRVKLICKSCGRSITIKTRDEELINWIEENMRIEITD